MYRLKLTLEATDEAEKMVTIIRNPAEPSRILRAGGPSVEFEVFGDQAQHRDFVEMFLTDEDS